MSATNSWILDGLTVSTELAELVAIIGLRTVVNYKAFMCLRQLDKALEEIPHNVATAMKSLYQQAGYTSHPQVWLSNLKSTLKNPTSISTILMEYFTHKRIFDEYQDTWNSLSSVPSNSNTTPNELISVLSENSSYNDAAVKSSTYVNNLLSILLSAYGGSTSLNNTQRFDLFETTFETWKNTINSFGGVTGAEGLIAVVAINQLERISNYSALPTANDETLTSLGQEGLEITKYLSNTPFLEDAFAGLAS